MNTFASMQELVRCPFSVETGLMDRGPALMAGWP